MRKALCVALLIVSAVFSSGCYAMRDMNGQWWACEDYATPNGTATACTPFSNPF